MLINNYVKLSSPLSLHDLVWSLDQPFPRRSNNKTHLLHAQPQFLKTRNNTNMRKQTFKIMKQVDSTIDV